MATSLTPGACVSNLGAAAYVPKTLPLTITAVIDRGDCQMAYRYMVDFAHANGRTGWLQTEFPFAAGDTFEIFDEGGKTYVRYPRPYRPRRGNGGGIMALIGKLFPVHDIPGKEPVMNELIPLATTDALSKGADTHRITKTFAGCALHATCMAAHKEN